MRYERIGSRIRLAGALAFLCLASCNESPLPMQPPGDVDAALSPALVADAQQILANGTAGTHPDAYLDEMLLVERIVPGFGGYFYQSGGYYAYLKNPGDSTRVRNAIVAIYGTLAGPRHAQVIGGRFSLSELMAMQQKALSAMSATGLDELGIDLKNNQLLVGFVDSASSLTGVVQLKQLGIPRAALSVEVVGIAIAL